MSCRSTAASSTVVSLAVATTGLDESQIKSLFHELKREGKDSNGPTEVEYSAGLDKIRLRVNSELNDRPNFQSRLLERIEKARTDGPVDGATWYAITDLNAEASASHARLQKVLLSLAETLGEDTDSFTAYFDNLRKTITEYEDKAATEKIYRFDLIEGLPKDDATKKALRRLGYQIFLEQPYPVFVYGTLRPGQGNHGMMEPAVTSYSQGTVSGVGIYGAHQGFPYASEHEDSTAQVVGDLVYLSEDNAGYTARRSMDYLEGFRAERPSSSHYERVLKNVTVVNPSGKEENVKAWMYLARGPSRAQLVETDRIIDGDWVKAKEKYREPKPNFWN